MTDQATTSIHLAIIPDGNRRWAKRQGLLPWQGHEQALKNSRTLLEWCRDHPRITTVTLWAFSTENWNRQSQEVKQLMRLYETFLRRECPELIKNKTRLVHAGRTDRIPTSLRQTMQETAEQTSRDYQLTLQIALDYGGRDEIVRAINKIENPAEITEETFKQYFDQPDLPDIDLIIRTSGEQRTSNFFMWQAAYAEWFFTDKLYPELEPGDLAQAVTEFEQRHRRFGA